jgi:hypothetical protein
MEIEIDSRTKQWLQLRAARCCDSRQQLRLPEWFARHDFSAQNARNLFNYSVTVLATVLLPAAETMTGAIKPAMVEKKPGEIRFVGGDGGPEK